MITFLLFSHKLLNVNREKFNNKMQSKEIKHLINTLKLAYKMKRKTNRNQNTGRQIKMTFILFILLVFSITSIAQTTYYIDPTYSGQTQNGTIGNPYNSWSKVNFVNGNSYLQKRSTTASITQSISISGKNNITLGAYGTGERPKIFKTTSASSGGEHIVLLNAVSNFIIRDLEICGNTYPTNANTSAIMIGYTANSHNNLIDNCVLHDAIWGLRVCSDNATGNRVLNCTIYNSGDDGIYTHGLKNIEIAYCHIYDVNLRFHTNTSPNVSTGDCIQIYSPNNTFTINIHHNTLDHSSTGNKFCIIVSGGNYSGVIEYNTMIGNITKTVSCIYLFHSTGTVTVRYNTLKNTNGYAIYSYVKDLQFHYNQVINNTRGIGVINNNSNNSGLTALNNVFYNNKNYNIIAENATSVVSRNNIFYLSNNTQIAYLCVGTIVSDYNNFNIEKSNFINSYSTLASWRSASGNDVHSFVNNPLFVNSGNEDFRIQPASPCVNKGTNVSLNKDFFGTQVPQAGLHDIGFYEYIGSQSNNVAPVISNQTFTASQGTTNGTLVGKVVASDPNTGQTLSYTITSGNTNNAFALNQSNGNLTVANTSALNGNAFNLIVKVTDNGTPVLSSQATITVNITIPNQAPVINNQSFTISQNAANGTLAGTVVASDPNTGQTLAYTITSGNTNSAFALNQSSGKLTVANASALNSNAFNLIVKVTDNGTPVLSSQATITVNITIPNLAPVINNQSFTVSQNAANGTLAGTVVASDPNTGQTLAYTITSGNTNSAFALNQSSGKLTVANASALNGNAFNLIVRVTDNGTPALWAQATITVNITAAANQAPVINNQSFSISQNTANGALAGTVVASDPNTGQTLAYTITSGNTNNAFAINQTNGKITVANTSALNCNAFNLIVRVTDNGTPALWAQATITINIEGSTNQAPVIADQTFTLSQNATNGTYIGTVVASDPNPGQTINFIIISGNPNWAIALGGTQGKLIVSHATSLTGNTINLIVRVTDNGTPALWTEATITINMQRGPNQAPLIANQNFTLSQNAANGTYIGTVVASDPTPGQTLNYTIVSGNPNWAIALGGTQGKLIVSHASALNGNTINLIVRVTNNGTPALSSDANIKISFTKSTLPEEETTLPEMEKITEITAFPNPSTNGIFHVKCTEFKNQEGTLTVLSLTGSVIMQDNITGNSETLINLEAMPKGIYILRIVDGENIYTQKLIRQ